MYRTLVMYEFPWDMNQALSFALFRTYAVPGIGGLLDATGEFTARTQKRYDDTALLLERRYGGGRQGVGHGCDPTRSGVIRRAADSEAVAPCE